ncbi:MAG: NADH-quinone oxidoreductase subunit L [Chloroflexi bacterium]|nr:NADH-quinone oxidoreductase subunit L [Chloroflexota bacterium]
MVEVAWIIPALPLATFLLIVAVARSAPRLAHALAIAGVGAACLASVAVLAEVVGGAHVERIMAWFRIGQTVFTVGWVVDPLSAAMLVIVTTVSLAVHVYSVGYMHGDAGYARYFAFLNLFTVAMLGIVLAPTLLQLFVFWELVGLCSYLLIGHWYRKPEAAAAAKKAFLVTRLGDLGFLVGILMLWTATGTFVLAEIEAKVAQHALAPGFLTLAMLLLFCGAIGKSAQFPLHVWLPDAMEGPTPVSALIHAATMVAAGVYMVARLFPLFEGAPTALLVVAYVGIFTAFFAATMGLVAHDVKRVLAYSTISQLGYMMAGLGVGSLAAGMFHLFTHAYFKALLFLAAGSIIHGAATQDLREMGGLRRVMPITAITFAVGGLALAGVPPFSGFFSKDEILASALHAGQPVLFAVGLATAVMTAFYVSRARLLAFWGAPRWSASAAGSPGGSRDHAGHGGSADGHDAHAAGAPHDAHGHGAPHESPPVMTAVLVALGIPAALGGLLLGPASGNWFAHFLAPLEKPLPFDLGLAASGTAAALLGLGLAWLMYGARVISPEALAARLRPLYVACFRKWWVDELYGFIAARTLLGLARALAWFDLEVVDGVVNAVGAATRALGRGVRRLQSGQLPAYGLAIYAGVVVIAALVMLGPR